MTKKRRRGTPPKDRPDIKPSGPPANPGCIRLSFRLVEKGWGVAELTYEKAHAFLEKWEKRGCMTWDEIRAAPKHGLGSESLPASVIIPQLPEWMESGTKLLVFRHFDRLPQVGIRILDTFEVVWIEPEYNKLYSHDGKNRR